ncbi:Possible oxidoreductase [Phaffia rhodozyma]|uniref:Possible oxidoreductase n=1 Tax=Phaffia rhodozyma TaxID=264483 RepID=A0A0F7SHR9_PHARH|nr:Possible oxidoreductase [Phaffia rhodozyma]
MSSNIVTDKNQRNVVIIGGGIVGVSTAYYLSRHPNFDHTRTKITILEPSSIACAASGKAGGFLALDWHGKDTTPLSALSFGLHEALAKEHGGERDWGYRKIEAVSLQSVLSRPAKAKSEGFSLGKKAKSVKALEGWLSDEITGNMKLQTIGTTATCAQVNPKLLTQSLVRLSGATVLTASASSLSFCSDTKRVNKVIATFTDDSSSGHTKGESIEIATQDVVLAAGPWVGELAVKLLGQEVGGKLGVTGSRAHSVVVKPAEGIPVSPHAIFTSLTLKDGTECEPEIYPRPDGTAYICGAGDTLALPLLASQVQTDSTSLSTLKYQIAKLSPHLTVEGGATIIAEQACYLPVSDRGRPLVGKVRDVQGVWIGAGLSCWGITQGPGTGYCLAEGIMTGEITSTNVSRLAP